MTATVGDPREAAFAAYRRGDADARVLVTAALAEQPLDGGLLIADAVLAQEAGDPDPDAGLVAILDRAPDWIDGHVAVAELRWGRGDHAGCLDIMAAAARAQPRHAALWLRYLALLAACGRAGEAADAVRDLRGQAEVPSLMLIEARYGSAAGDLARAARLLERIPDGTPDLELERARLALRRGDPLAADIELAAHRRTHPRDHVGWGLTELVWRATGDRRHAWLMQDGVLFERFTALLDVARVAQLTDVLGKIHARRWPPLGQSIRQGSQTRGHLFERAEPALADTRRHIEEALVAYRRRLPGLDRDHPLHSTDQAALNIHTAWSVRLGQGGHHAAHVHPAGMFSAALHLTAVPDGGGELVLGMAPADMLPDVAPLCVLPPAPGQLQLFPSFLYHGTRPVDADRRLTVSFDVACRDQRA